MVGNRALTALYWVIGFVLAVLAGVAGASWGNSQAPTFGNDDTGGTPATGASRLLFSLFGGLLAAAAVLAVFAAVFMLLWVRARRSSLDVVDDYESDEGFLDHVAFGDDESYVEDVGDDFYGDDSTESTENDDDSDETVGGRRR